MAINVKIEAETPYEYATFLWALVRGIDVDMPQGTTQDQKDATSAIIKEMQDRHPKFDWRTAPAPGVNLPDPNPAPSATEDVTEALADLAGQAEPLAEQPAQPGKQPRKRRTKAEMARDAEQAALQADEDAQRPVQAARPPSNGYVQLDLFDDAPAPEEPDAEDISAAPAADPVADKAQALELLRAIYERPGMLPAVNALLADFGVAKFTLIPSDRGSELLAAAQNLAAGAPVDVVL
jgi:hypothetical protein